MPIFQPKSNIIWSLFFLTSVVGLVLLAAGGWAWKWSLYFTETGDFKEQTVPFSHAHHAGGLGIDCRYCHTSVEVSSNAGFPPTHTCMTCHSQIWTNAAILEPVRQSYNEDRPIRWRVVYNIPDYVYFNHSIHVAKGVGCSTCHGSVDRMPLTTKVMPFYMKECLECHNNPAKYLRPESEIFNMSWHPAERKEDASWLGQQLVRHYHIRAPHQLTDCYACHR